MRAHALGLLVRCCLICFACGMLVCALLLSLWATHHAHARDLDGKYADSPLKPWFNSLKSENGLCCSFADGVTINDAQWDTKDGHYRVYLDDRWIDVPDGAVVKVPNRYGQAVVWPLLDRGNTGNVYGIRCFMPGAGT